MDANQYWLGISMKILRVIPSLDPKMGGTVESARAMDVALTKLGASVEVVCLDEPGAGPYLESYPAPVHSLGPARFNYRYSKKLVPWLREHSDDYDCVVVDGVWQYHAFGAWRALRSCNTPYFVFTHGMLDPWFKRNYPFKHLKKWIYWPFADYRVLRDARAVLFTCEEERLLARESFWLYSCKELVTSFGTSKPPDESAEFRNAFYSKHPLLFGKRIVLFMGRIQEKKGCDLLVDAFARVANLDDDLHLVMAGPDQVGWIKQLKERAKLSGVEDRITFTGMISGDEKWGAFFACDVFCLPSHQENFGIVIAEALGCGKSVLISDKVNIWKEVESDGAAIVNSDTLEGTYRSLRDWLALDKGEIERMRAAARESFRMRFFIDQVAADFLKMLSIHCK
jgi:glycosyltransferase involved in cell wall biosynthesis